MFKIKFFLAILCICIFFSAKIQAEEITVKDNKIRIIDDTGYELVLDEPAKRVLGLYGALSEMILSLDMGHTLVGRTYADAEVEGLKHLPPIATQARVIPERIFEVKPDVVLQFMGSEESKALGLGLRKLGVPVLLFRLQNFEDIFSALQRLGKLTGTENKAAELVKSYSNRIGHLRNILMDLPRVPVFYEVRYPYLLTIGSETLVADILHVAGASNVISGSKPLIRIAEDDLLPKNPEAYIIQEGLLNAEPIPLVQRPGFEHLQAVKNNRILTVKARDFANPGPRAIDAAEKLAHWLHPHVNFNIQTPERKELIRK